MRAAADPFEVIDVESSDETLYYKVRRGDLSRLVEEALRAQIFEKSVERVKRRTARVEYARLKAIVREAVQYARRTR